MNDSNLLRLQALIEGGSGICSKQLNMDFFLLLLLVWKNFLMEDVSLSDFGPLLAKTSY